MAEDRRFIIEIRSKGFQKAKRNLVQVKNDVNKLTSATKVAEGQTRSHVAAMNKNNTVMAAFRRESSALRNNILLYTFAVGGAVAAVSNLVKAFADAQDTTNRFRAVFKELTPEAEKFASAFGDRFGFARTEVMKMMETFQGLFVPLGFSREAAAGLSEAMVKLTMDVGSFQDVDPTQVAQMFTSALIGNHEAVRRLNIALTENSVKNAAVNNGFALSRNLVSDQAKVMGRMLEILRQSNDAIGDGARTYDDYNNRVRRLNQQVIELRQNLGESLLSWAELGVSLAEMTAKTEVLVPTLTVLISSFIAGKTAITAWVLATRGLAGALAIGIGPLGLFVTGITGLAFAASSLISKYKETEKSTSDLVTKKSELKSLIEKINDDLNVEAQTLKLVSVRNKELREATAKRNTSLALELALIGETSRMAQEMIKARLEENRALTETEIKLIAMIEQRKADAEAAKDQAQAIKDSEEALKTRLEDLQIEAATMDTNSVLIKAMVEARIRHNTVLSTSEIALLTYIDKLRLEKDAMDQANAAIQTRINNLQTLQQRVKAVRDENSAMATELITGDKKAAAERTTHLELLTNLTDVYATSTGQTAKRVQQFQDSISGLSFEDLTTFDFSILDQQAEGMGNIMQAFQENASLTAQLMDTQNTSMMSGAKSANIMASAIIGVAGAMKTMGDSSISEGQRMSTMLQTIGSIMMMIPGMQVPGAALTAGSMFIGHTGGLIKDNGIQRFAQGGMVRGQDNVPIMAQAGEFIMRRDAVQNIGVQNLAEMNQSGSSGGVTVNVQGNMIGNESFVRDILVPELSRAQRQNLA